MSFAVSDLLIHKQITLYGSWVTSLRHMEDLLEHLVRWNLHPETVVTHRFALDQADEAYRVADQGLGGRFASCSSRRTPMPTLNDPRDLRRRVAGPRHGWPPATGRPRLVPVTFALVDEPALLRRR